MPAEYPGRLRGWRFILLNVATGLANVVVLSNVPGYTILAPYAAANLQGVTPSFGTWATTDHMIGLALGFPIARWLAARFGDYRVYAVALALYAFFSLLCASSATIWAFVPMRFLLGLPGGVILPVGQAILLGEYPPEKRTLGVGIWGVLSMMPFTIGVFMGGWWAEFFGWRAMFLSNVVIALTVAAVTGSLFYGRRIKRLFSRFDGVGFCLLAIILLGVQTIFNQGNDFDWFASPVLAGALIVTTAASTFFIWELGERHPAIDFPPQDRPPVVIPFFTFRIMVGCGLIMLTIAWLGSYLSLKNRIERSRFVLWLVFLSFPPPFIAVLTGWYTAEVGRQPWVVYRVLRTADAMTPFLMPREATISLVVFCVIYTFIFAFGIFYIHLLLRAGPAGHLIEPPSAAVPNRPMSVAHHALSAGTSYVDDGEPP